MKCRSFRLNNGFQIAENKQGRQTLETTSEKACYVFMCYVTKYSTILGVPYFLD